MRILLVEDDALLGDGIREGLIDKGFTVDWLMDGAQASAALATETSFDALVLDLNIPGMHGLDVLRALRQRGNRLPVLILTARDDVNDRIHGLDGGADDYLAKPFALGELAARLRALLRRSGADRSSCLQHAGIVFDPALQHVTHNGVALDLTARELQLLWILLRSYPHVLSRDQIEQRLYGWQGGAESNALEVHLSHLRKKLGATSILNMRGIGWRLA